MGGKNQTIKIADFFCGNGNIGRGFEQANKNYKVVFANDMDKYCKETYDNNSDGVKLTLKNITDIDEKKLQDFDIFCGGFPCQPFSIAGKQKGFKDKRANVFYDILRIIKHKKPKCIFLENVKNITTHDKGNTFNIIKQHLENLGYILYYKVLNSCEYGNIPHNRERIYIIGFLNYDPGFNFIDKIPLTLNLSDIIQTNVPDKYYYTATSSIYEKLQEVVVKRNTIYQYRRTYVRENKSNLCPTLTANMGTGGHNVPIILDNKGIRKLTPLECFRLQGLNESFIIPEKISDCHLFKQAGNSVTLPVIKRLAEKIYEYYHKDTTKHVTTVKKTKPKDKVDLNKLKVPELKKLCKKHKLGPYSKLRKAELIELLSG